MSPTSTSSAGAENELEQLRSCQEAFEKAGPGKISSTIATADNVPISSGESAIDHSRNKRKSGAMDVNEDIPESVMGSPQAGSQIKNGRFGLYLNSLANLNSFVKETDMKEDSIQPINQIGVSLRRKWGTPFWEKS
uniref:Uncharacterized protein n=1 Tax=Octactis speculum TaxID=3111310 RepID=A0A7S2AVJ8_9STRA|mmetsp:Transcript_16150/g.21761  ORF Transcript_16150/g.21761 Transcript_16150/m.21761 type:complete len:136 (+) Transcript_16150:50-457(+)